jgi:hypothetical protein
MDALEHHQRLRAEGISATQADAFIKLAQATGDGLVDKKDFSSLEQRVTALERKRARERFYHLLTLIVGAALGAFFSHLGAVAAWLNSSINGRAG